VSGEGPFKKEIKAESENPRPGGEVRCMLLIWKERGISRRRERPLNVWKKEKKDGEKGRGIDCNYRAYFNL